jgi:molybdopterin/thiamine biosynthesis adenylyltransferase
MRTNDWKDLTYRPEILRIGNPVNRARWEELSKTESVTVIDTILGQIEDLVEIEDPARRMGLAARTRAARKRLRTRPPGEYGVWVYYPWRCVLVRLLEEDDFVKVRTSRNKNLISQDDQNELSTKKIGIIGMSVGQVVAVTMAMERVCGEIRIADFDHLSLSNLNRVRASLVEVGLPKAIIAARVIAEIDPFITVKCFPLGVTESNLDLFLLGRGALDVLVDEADSLEIKLLARLRARDLGIPVLMATSDRGMLDVERFDNEPDRPLLHGLIEEMDAAQVRNLSTEEKVPHVLRIVGTETVSRGLRASMSEVGRTIPAWPQLASAVALGGAMVTDVARRMLLGCDVPSGRNYIDLQATVASRGADQECCRRITSAQLLSQDLTSKPGNVLRTLAGTTGF